MLQWLLDTIKNYLYNLNDEGLYVSIHTDFAEYMLPLLEFNIHQNPKCLLVKSDDHEWNNCIRIHRSGQFSGTFQKRRCPKGVEEFVFPLQDGGTVCVRGDLHAERRKNQGNHQSVVRYAAVSGAALPGNRE